MRKTVTVFCASDPTGSKAEEYLEMARSFGEMLADAGLVCLNGGGGGMMQALSEGAHHAGGEVRLVSLTEYPPPHNCHDGVVYEDALRNRQHRLIVGGDAYVAMPGGLGTALEVLDVASRMVLGELDGKPPVICIGAFWHHLKGHLAMAIEDGLINGNATNEIIFVDTPQEAMVLLKQHLSD
jgi:uncharacterized protein (TIGR00730 family)